MINFNGEPFYIGRQSPSEMRLLDAAVDSPACESGVSQASLVAASKRAEGNVNAITVDVLASYDNYYYDRKFLKSLPVVRVRLSDTKGTWLYLNPKSALIQARYTERSRWERWLYNGLHSLDSSSLFYRRPLWDVIVVVLSLGGFTLSVTGIMLSIRYFLKTFKKRRPTLKHA